ncbi:RNA polymerase sigma factor [Rhodopseudomonas sp.]|uniref:RNA polymerase sigma factor n=1 Tax=Rhodopseudomonas sp. TaxID=1078 RepID=UPI0039E314A1
MGSYAVLATLRQCARRHSRIDHEVDDLVQDVLLLAVARGRAITDPGFVAWAKGAIRNHASFVARTAGRRRVRDAAWGTQCATSNPPPRFSLAFLSSLPPAQRIVALLVNLGLGRAEITHLLGLSDVAFRQRLSGLRKSLHANGGEAEFSDPSPSFPADGLARRSLKKSLHLHAARTFAIRDPDGVPIFFSRRDHVVRDSGN